MSHDCAEELKREIAELGADATVSTEPPIVRGPYTVDALVCPHGCTYWIEPTGEQIAAWTAAGVK